MLLFVFPGWTKSSSVFSKLQQAPSTSGTYFKLKACTRNDIFKGAHAELSNQKAILFT